MIKTHPKMNIKGFSLVEVLLVVVIVGFIINLITHLPNSIGLIGKSRFESVAKDIASQKIEDIRTITYDNLANGTVSISDSRVTSLPSGSGSYTVIDCPGTICKNSEQIKQVTVEVDWQESKVNKNVQITTFIAKNGLK